MAGEWETVGSPSGGWETVGESKPTHANAGMVNFATGVLGMAGNAAVLPFEAARTGLMAAGRYDLANKLPSVKNVAFGSEWMNNLLRKTGIEGLSPDNPNPKSKTGTAAYDLTSRGGFIPGGFLPAVGSMIAEKIGGPQWGGVGALAPSAIAQGVRAVMPNIQPNPQADLLQKEGVSLTPGQRMGGVVKRMEDAATSIPVLGDAIKAAQKRGIESFDAAAINRSLAPIGETLPKGLKGNAAVEYAYGKLGDAYENLLPNLKGELGGPGPNALPSVAGQAAPVTLKQELDNIRTMGQELPEPQRGQLDRIINREVESRFTSSGLASGDTIKRIEEQLGKLAKGFGRSDNYDTRILGGAVEETHNALRRMIERVNPEYSGELSKINEGYANFKKVQNAAANVGAPEGVFTPAQLHRAVKAGDISKDKARFAEGNALMQDLSTAGKAVLPSSVPDSGTPFRGALMYALANPLKAGALALPVTAATLPYTPAGQSLLKYLMDSQRTQPAGSPILRQGLLQGILAQQQGNQ